MTEWAVPLVLEVVDESSGVQHSAYRVMLTKKDPLILRLDDDRIVRIRLATPTRPEIPTPPPPNPDPSLTTYLENSR